MKKICFASRDGALLARPSGDEPINGLEDMRFAPKVISSLKRLAENGWTLAMTPSRTALGTSSASRANYEKINRKLFEILASEEIYFWEAPGDYFDKSHSDNHDPQAGKVDGFLRQNRIDHTKSFVVGDMESDARFAENMGVRVFLTGEWSWDSIADEMINQPRRAVVTRKTKETDIVLKLNLDGVGKTIINTGLKFFDHMLEQIGRHANFDLEILCKGDLEVDEHHTVEDTALALGEALKISLGDKRGVERYGSEKIIVMDESKCEAGLDLSGRPYFVLDAEFTREYVGDFPTEMLHHFLYSFAQSSGATLNIKLTGQNNHHLIEAAFKGLARVLREATRRTSNLIPSTKGSL